MIKSAKLVQKISEVSLLHTSILPNPMKNPAVIGILISLASCQSNDRRNPVVERYAESLDNIVSLEAQIDTIATGFEWAEGPVWIASENMLLFSDVPKNIVYA